MNEYGLIFAGGGARGSYQVGVWKALRELGIKIVAVAGTSVGAINGAVFAQKDYEMAKNVWENIDYNAVFTVNPFNAEERAKMSLQEKLDFLITVIKNKGLDTHALKALLNKYIDEKKIRESDIYYGLVTFSVTDMKPVIKYIDEIPEGKLTDYIMASAAVPLFFSDHVFDDKHYVDGGVYDNVPVSVLADKGYKNLIVVDLSAIGRVKKVDTEGLNIITIKSTHDAGGILQFEKEQVAENMQIGYLDALKAFEKVKGIKYYLDYQDDQFTDLFKFPDREEYYQWMMDLELVNLQGKPDGFITYLLLRRLKSYCELKLTDISGFVAAMEITAEVLKIDRLKIYTLESLTRAIVDKYKEIMTNPKETNPIKEVSGLIWKQNKSALSDEQDTASFTSTLIRKMDISAQKLRSAGYPDLCIANLFIYMLYTRSRESFGDDLFL